MQDAAHKMSLKNLLDPRSGRIYSRSVTYDCYESGHCSGLDPCARHINKTHYFQTRVQTLRKYPPSPIEDRVTDIVRKMYLLGNLKKNA
jgi:hypothetical protein